MCEVAEDVGPPKPADADCDPTADPHGWVTANVPWATDLHTKTDDKLDERIDAWDHKPEPDPIPSDPGCEAHHTT